MNLHIPKIVVLSAVFFLLNISLVSQTPTKVESELLAALDRVGKFGTYLGNYDEAKNAKANEDVTVLLVRHGKRKDILKYSFAKLKKEMDVATSRDGKFRIYSWDMHTGGTMHFHNCVFQYQSSGGRVQARACSSNDGDSGAFYSRIFQVQSKNGPIYLGNSTFIAQGTTHGQAIEAFRIIGDKLELKPKVIKTKSGLTNRVSFEYNPFTIEDGNESDLIHYDPNAAAFRFPVVIDDDASGRSGRITDRYITYKFDGKYFVKVS